MNILPTIVQETVGQCKRQGYVVSAALAQFYIKCQLLTAKKDAQNNVEVTPEHVEQLVNGAVRTLTMNDSAVLETFKLQASVTTAQQEQVNKLRTERVQHKAKSQRLMEEVWSKRDPNEVFGDITLFVMHESHTTQLHDETSQRETMAALETVFPKSLMDSFIAQKEADKIRQMEEIWRIVWGIRLYNFFSSKGGSGIPNLVDELQTAVQQVTGDSLNLQDEVAAQAREYSAVLSCPSLEFPDAERIRLQDELHNRLQIRVYLKSLLSTLKALTAKVRAFEPTWQSTLDEASALLQGSDMASVPKAAIYPHFMTLSERWGQLISLHREALDAGALFKVITAFNASYTPTIRPSDIDHALSGLAPERPPNHDATATEIAQISGIQFMVELPADKSTSRLEFNGFCIVSFVDDGILVEAKTEDKTCPGFLLLAANSALYGFSSERNLKTFARDPFKYLSQKLMDLVASNPVLIYLLGLHPYIPRELYLVGSRKQETQRIVERGDGATQTGHIDTYKDTHYVWSEWELRRLALQLASLRNKRTKSCQTSLSHFRRENEAQVYLPKVQATQTLHDAAVQPPRVVRYIKGLRGTTDAKVEVVEKTFLY
jgi:hypothetical protein